MARITVEDCLTKENNRFALVHLAAKRAKQLLAGAKSLATERRDNKSVVMALREIASGKVEFMTEEEVRQAESLAQEEARAREAERLARQQAAAQAAANLANSPLAAAVGDDDDEDEVAEEPPALNGDGGAQ